MSFPDAIREVLRDVGQVAAEVPCLIDGCREFVSVYAVPRERVMNIDGRFPYYSDATTLYRVIRFRVDSALIETDANIGPQELIGLQEIFLPSENDVAFVMNLWRVSIEDLRSPDQVEIPV